MHLVENLTLDKIKYLVVLFYWKTDCPSFQLFTHFQIFKYSIRHMTSIVCFLLFQMRKSVVKWLIKNICISVKKHFFSLKVWLLWFLNKDILKFKVGIVLCFANSRWVHRSFVKFGKKENDCVIWPDNFLWLIDAISWQCTSNTVVCVCVFVSQQCWPIDSSEKMFPSSMCGIDVRRRFSERIDIEWERFNVLFWEHTLCSHECFSSVIINTLPEQLIIACCTSFTRVVDVSIVGTNSTDEFRY